MRAGGETAVGNASPSTIFMMSTSSKVGSIEEEFKISVLFFLYNRMRVIIFLFSGVDIVVGEDS